MKGKPRHSRPGDPAHGSPRNGGGGERARPRRQSHNGSPAHHGRGVWLYGIHPVLAALANPRRRCYRIVLTNETEMSVGPRIDVLAQGHPIGLPDAEIASRDHLDRLLPKGAVHQGIAIQVDGLEEPSIEDICRATEIQDRATVIVLDQVSDPHNVGAILRSAAAFNAAAVVMPERHSPGATATMAKAASGALEKVPLVRVINLARALDQLKQAGYWCVGFDAAASVPLNEADLSGKIALVVGAEGEGLRRLTRERCDLMVRIPIARGTESLNVSNATAIALYEFARRR